MEDILARVVLDVWTTIAHTWPFLLASVVIASAIQVYVGTDRLARWLRARTVVAVGGAVLLAALTPFCSCGTTAVVLGALASAVPWAPVVAFMVSSPLTSPGEYVFSIGLFGTAFATTFFVAAIVIGLLAGWITSLIERAGALVGQARMKAPATEVLGEAAVLEPAACGCGAVVSEAPTIALRAPTVALGELGGRTALAVLEPVVASCGDGCGSEPAADLTRPASRVRELGRNLVVNLRRLAGYFLAFAALGYLIIELIPTEALTGALGADSVWSVPLAATLGIPVYVNSDASLPLVASLMDGGMGPGAALAFLVTGAGTSVGAVSGMLIIARWKVVALVVGFLWVGAVVLGYLAPIWLG